MPKEQSAAYLRISEDRTGLEAGVTRQREDCLRRARERGWTVVAVESDNDKSAKSGAARRPGFERLIQRIEAGQVKHVVAWTLDRLQRNRRDELRLYEACERHGVTVSLVRGPDLEWETPTGRFLADNLSSAARLEIELKGDRYQRAELQRRQAGYVGWSRRPYGYRRRGKRIYVVEAEAEVLRYAAERVLKLRKVAPVVKDLNDAGHKTALGQPWNPTTLRRCLLNPRYAGVVEYQGERLAETSAAWDAIFSPDTAQRLSELLRDPSRTLHNGTNNKYLLSGLAECGRCGGVMYTHPVAKPLFVYRCVECYLARGMERVDRVVTAVVLGRMALPDAASLLAPETDLNALRETAADVRARRDALTGFLAEGVMSADAVGPRVRDLTDELHRLEVEIAQALGEHPGAVLAGADSAERAAELWEGLPLLDRREVVKALMTVRILPVGKGVRWKDEEAARHVQIVWR